MRRSDLKEFAKKDQTENEIKENIQKVKKATKKRLYFTKEHEQAILDYCLVSDLKERERLYLQFISPTFDEMITKIVFTYKFTHLPNIEELMDECKMWLITILDKFDSSKGFKAFSYFSVITKNWFIHKVKKHQKQSKIEVSLEEKIKIPEIR